MSRPPQTASPTWSFSRCVSLGMLFVFSYVHVAQAVAKPVSQIWKERKQALASSRAANAPLLAQLPSLGLNALPVAAQKLESFPTLSLPHSGIAKKNDANF